jgi:hypothetical protein
MGEGPTLILTTRSGVRPLGVRGEPLHAVAGQLLSVIRRRLGNDAADLLADPQLRESGDGIDWYAARTGAARQLSELDEAGRAEALRTFESHLNAIRGLAGQLSASGASDEARLIGRSLELATRRPSDDFVYLVDGHPVIAAWGYEADAAASLQAAAPSLPTATALPPSPSAVLASAPLAVLPARPGWARWLGLLLFGLLLLLLLLIASWLLRACAPVDPSMTIATHETPAPPAPPRPPDPTPVLKASLDGAQTDAKKLKVELAALEDQLRHKVEQCKPIAPPKPPPPPVAKAPPPSPPPQHAAAPPVSRPPPGMLPCDWSGDSGGEGVTRNRH